MSEKHFDGIQYARNIRDEERAREDREHSKEEVTDAILFSALGEPATRVASKPLWKRKRKKAQKNEIEQIESD